VFNSEAGVLWRQGSGRIVVGIQFMERSTTSAQQ
jgi:hypothetical protein